MLAPIITFRQNIAPYTPLASLSLKTFAPNGNTLPVLAGEQSIESRFRIYNNYALTVGVASALNLQITTFDGIGSGSHSATKSVIGNKWVKLQQYGFGESTGTPAPFTYWKSQAAAVGGSIDTFLADKGSNGSTYPKIRAGADYNSCGFVELSAMAEIPSVAIAENLTFVITALYDYVA